MRNGIEEILKSYRPVMNGEIYLSGGEMCRLYISANGLYSNIVMMLYRL
ncbi:hypothetical protein [Sphingobacterium spiritivorum]